MIRTCFRIFNQLSSPVFAHLQALHGKRDPAYAEVWSEAKLTAKVLILYFYF